MSISLVVTAGPHIGRRFVFHDHDVFLVGRAKPSHFQIADKDIFFSRIHFLVELNPPSCRLIDLKSQNGTFVNGKRATSHELRHRDEIKAGHTFVHVEVAGGSAQGTAQVAGPVGPKKLDAPLPRIAGYRVDGILGHGTLGTVYHGIRLEDELPVAIKVVVPVIPPEPAVVEALLARIDPLWELEHPNFIRPIQLGDWDGMLVFISEFVDGPNISEILADQGALPPLAATRIAIQILEGLEHGHAAGFFHYDLKPTNILVAEQADGSKVVKLADYGLARAHANSPLSGASLTRDVPASANWLPPEFLSRFRDPGPAADQFGVAAVLYHMLTDGPLYNSAHSDHLLVQVLDGNIVPIRSRRGDIPTDLAAAVHRGLSLDPADRFPDFHSFAAALRRYAK